ncbi:MAG TPA: hypothetical protein VFQ38_06675 [Longimicrobiales bacterium]|nr:hypothetical protein [Longimicrobiales bacterium]
MNTPRRSLIAACACAGVLGLAGAAAAQRAAAPAYAVTARLAIGGDGGWDYLTVAPDGHRLFVSRSTHVQVVDLDRDSVVGDIPNTPGVHGIALVPAVGRGFTSNGRDSSVTIFDLKTLDVLGRVHIPGRNPDAIAFEPASGRVFTMNGGSGSATALDPATGAVVGTVEFGGKPEAAASDGNGRFYINVEDRSEVVAVDPRRLAVEAHWPLAPCEEPTGMAIDRVRHRLFVGCGNRMMAVVDAESGKVVATLPIGGGVDGVAFDSAAGLAFSSNGEGTITVVRGGAGDRYAVAQTVPTQLGARTIALDPPTHRLFLPAARYGPRPAPTPDMPTRRPPVIPGSFTVLVVASGGAAHSDHHP